MFSSRHEDLAVEAIGYILQSESARKSIAELARKAGAELDAVSAVRTQSVGEDASRPDLTCIDQCGKKCLLVEAKFWAHLTPNQPNAYLKQLSPGKALLFVAPGKRIEPLWDELKDRTSNRGSERTNNPKVRSLQTIDKKYLMLTSWDYLLSHLESSADAEESAEIQQLRGLTSGVETGTGETLHPSGPNELDLAGLVRDVATGAAAAGFASMSGLKATKRPTGYGRYLLLAGAGAWLGVDTQHWEHDSCPNTPLWLHFECWTVEPPVSFSTVRQAFREHDMKGTIIDEKNVYVPLQLPERIGIGDVKDFVKPFKGSKQVQPFPYGVTYEEVLRAVVNDIKEVARIINPAQTEG